MVSIVSKNYSYLRSASVGVTFAAAWTPCIGPILGILLTMAASSGSALQGSFLLACYSLGLGIWFLLFAIFTSFFQDIFKRIMPYSEKIMIIFGLIFCMLGLLLITGNFSSLNSFFIKFGILESVLNLESTLSNDVDKLYGPVVAVAAGILSFFSPCVLPLVPVYLINLSGEVINSQSQKNGLISFSPVVHASFFIIGFTSIFVLLGTSAGIMGSFLLDNLKVINQITGAVIFLFGVQMTGLISIPILNRTFKIP